MAETYCTVWEIFGFCRRDYFLHSIHEKRTQRGQRGDDMEAATRRELVVLVKCEVMMIRDDTLTFKGNMLNNPYPTAFPYGNGMVLHFYQQQESSTTKTVHKVINKGLKTYV